MKPIILISKDILMPNYLPTYGNTHWKTPNIDALVSKGTVFRRHYTAAPSTAMAFTSMFTGEFPYQLDRTKYVHVDKYQDKTMFDTLAERGYTSHIVWSDNYMKVALPFANCFSNATIHTLDMNQPVGPYIKGLDDITRDNDRAEGVIEKLFGMVKKIVADDVFLWIHLPHVILGRCAYGDDIDLVDKFVGMLRTLADDDCFYITADHGNMNGSKGKWVYGFEVYESAIHIPLITPRLDGKETVDYPTTNVDLAYLILDKKMPSRDYIISDSAYYAQPNRSVAIIKDNYKLIYNKLHNSFEMYDVVFDKEENVNLLNCRKYDSDRRRYTNVREVFYYPDWDNVDAKYNELLEIFNVIYRKAPLKDELIAKMNYCIVKLLGKYINRRNIKKKKVRK